MSRKPWHERDPRAYEDLQDKIEVEFPELHFLERDGLIILSGVYPLADKNGRVIDTYRIEVIVPPDGPRSDIPIVREVEGRIPRDSDHHMGAHGVACLCVPDEFWYNNPGGMDLVDFLKGPVRNYFVGQSLVKEGKQWPQGERSHGPAGIVEFYADIVGTDNLERIEAYLNVLAATMLRGHWDCPCGGGRRIRKCHLPLLTDLRERIPASRAMASLEELKKGMGIRTV